MAILRCGTCLELVVNLAIREELVECRKLPLTFVNKLLKNANGLIVEGDWLVHGGLTWRYFDRHSGKQVDSRVQPDAELEDFDGITADGQGGFFVTLIDDARVWHIKANGDSVPLSSEKLNGIDLYYQTEISTLLIPQVGGGLSVFSVILPMMN